jgi:hypothetical protein
MIVRGHQIPCQIDFSPAAPDHHSVNDRFDPQARWIRRSPSDRAVCSPDRVHESPPTKSSPALDDVPCLCETWIAHTVEPLSPCAAHHADNFTTRQAGLDSLMIHDQQALALHTNCRSLTSCLSPTQPSAPLSLPPASKRLTHGPSTKAANQMCTYLQCSYIGKAAPDMFCDPATHCKAEGSSRHLPALGHAADGSTS